MLLSSSPTACGLATYDPSDDVPPPAAFRKGRTVTDRAQRLALAARRGWALVSGSAAGRAGSMPERLARAIAAGSGR